MERLAACTVSQLLFDGGWKLLVKKQRLHPSARLSRFWMLQWFHWITSTSTVAFTASVPSRFERNVALLLAVSSCLVY